MLTPGLPLHWNVGPAFFQPPLHIWLCCKISGTAFQCLDVLQSKDKNLILVQIWWSQDLRIQRAYPQYLEFYIQDGSRGSEPMTDPNDHVLLLLCKCDNLACWQVVTLGVSRDSYTTLLSRVSNTRWIRGSEVTVEISRSLVGLFPRKNHLLLKFSLNWPTALGRFGHRVAMSACLFVCLWHLETPSSGGCGDLMLQKKNLL